MGCKGRRAALGPRSAQYLREFLYDHRVLPIEIPALREVIANVEELSGVNVGSVSPLGLEPVRLAVTVVTAGRVDEDPVPLADGELPGTAVVYGKLSHRRIRISPQQRQDADAVLSRALRQLDPGDFGAGGHQVPETDQLIAAASLGYRGGP